MKSLRHKRYFHLLMAFLVVVAAFLFQMRQGTWITLLKTDTETHTIHSQHSYHIESSLSLIQHITSSDTSSESSEHSHHQDFHANHDAHCLFCITQAFSDSPVLYTKLANAFHTSVNNKVIHFVLPLFIASDSYARAPPH